jgi:hypothetical protein
MFYVIYNKNHIQIKENYKHSEQNIQKGLRNFVIGLLNYYTAFIPQKA